MPRVFYKLDKNAERWNFVPMAGTWSQVKASLMEKFKVVDYKATFENGNQVKDHFYLKDGTRILLQIVKQIQVFYRFRDLPGDKFHWLNQEGTWAELRKYLATNSKKQHSARVVQAEYANKPGKQISLSTRLVHGDKILVYYGFPLGTIEIEGGVYGRFHEVLDWGASEESKILALQTCKMVPFADGSVWKRKKEQKQITPPKNYSCNKCGDHHFITECPELITTNVPAEDYKCKRCEQGGHYMVNCDKRVVVDLSEKMIINLADFEDDE